jgi:hypothetical protein
MMGKIGRLNFSLQRLINPNVGVNPPSLKALHNSILSAPPFTAASVLAKSVVAISTKYFKTYI